MRSALTEQTTISATRQTGIVSGPACTYKGRIWPNQCVNSNKMAKHNSSLQRADRRYSGICMKSHHPDA